jgi:hypothetical protein
VLETINWLALTIPFVAAGAAYVALQKMRIPKVLASIIATTILATVFLGYSFLYHSLGFPLWMRWLVPSAQGEPLPGRPEVQINTNLNADWTIVGMNYDWMVLVARAHLQIGSRPEAFMRWEYANPQKTDDGKLYLSEVQQIELDCAASRWNPLVVITYTENNLTGAEVYSGRGDPRKPLWDKPDSKSIFAAAIKSACELFTAPGNK